MPHPSELFTTRQEAVYKSAEIYVDKGQLRKQQHELHLHKGNE